MSIQRVLLNRRFQVVLISIHTLWQLKLYRKTVYRFRRSALKLRSDSIFAFQRAAILYYLNEKAVNYYGKILSGPSHRMMIKALKPKSHDRYQSEFGN